MSQTLEECVLVDRKRKDEELMTLYVQGDEYAFQELFHRYRSQVYGYLLKRVKDGKNADDLFQTVFFNLHRSRESYDPKQPFAAWLFVICRNVTFDYFRSETRKKETRLDEMEEIAGHSIEAGSSEIGFKQLLKELSPKQQEAIRLRYVDNLDFDEIAEKLNSNAINIRKLVSRAIKKIRRDS